MADTLPGFTTAEFEARGGSWTAREIAQQPAVWLEVEKLVARERAALDAFLGPLLANPALRIVFCGAGTSAFVGDCLAPAFASHLRRTAEAIATTDIVSGPPLHLWADRPTLLVSFARSGSSPESVATVDLAEQIVRDVHHLIITCNPEGHLALRARTLRSARTIVLPDATNDRGFAMTSSFTAMLLTAGLVFGLIRKDRVAALSRAAEGLLSRASPLAQKLVGRKFHRVVYLGSNELRGLASEAALKLLELTDGRTVAISQSSLGFRHGPKTIIDDKTLVIVMLANEAHARAYDRDLLAELRRDARAAEIVALTARVDDLAAGEHVAFDGMNDARTIELALLHILPAQVFALAQSLALGLTPDRPNAAGVVNRVVQGVTIHPWSGA